MRSRSAASPVAARSGAQVSRRRSRAKFCRKGYTIDYTGEVAPAARRKATSSSRLRAFAVALIFLVLAAQFNSFRDPFIILLGSVPLAMFGACIFMFLKMPYRNMPFFTNGWTTTFNIYSQVGLVTLVGLVSKNGILIVRVRERTAAPGPG